MIRRVLLTAALAVAAGYQVQRTVAIPATPGLLGSIAFEDFYGSEGSYRWSRERSAVVFPDPGPGADVRVELDVSGWRPRGLGLPVVTIEAGAGGLTAHPSPRGETLSFRTRTYGWWRSDLKVRIESETFRASGQDPRALGVRVQAARLVPVGPLLSPRLPPVGQVVVMSLALLLQLGLLLRLGVPDRTAERVVRGLAIAAGLAYALARPYAALASRPYLVLMGAALAFAWAAPAAARLVAEVAAESARAAARGLRALGLGGSAGLVVAGVAAVSVAYATRPTIEVDLGSGRETDLARNFGAFDSLGGVTFRQAQRGADLDLGDFGGGSRWRIAVTASAGGPPRGVELFLAGRTAVHTKLDERWTTTSYDVPAPFGWRSGLVIEFPDAPEALKLRIDRVVVDRGRSLPSLRILLAVVGAALLLGVGLAAAGLAPRAGLLAGATLLAGEAAALGADPLLVVPFAGTFFGIVAAGTLLLALATGLSAVAARRGAALLPSPGALAAAGLGFVAWLSAAAFPLYRGGNFAFHSAIAEEIWKGRFLIYYLPYPGSMLSQQAQWGNVVVPHPCLYQTLVAPLAALPRPWFYLAEKGVLAFWFASMAVVASLLAARAAGARAGVWAAVVMAGLVPTFQLLGLGHSMTILGSWASTLALSLIVLRADRLRERSGWWVTVAALTFCFLSYTAALLFTGLVLAMVLPALAVTDRPLARSLVGAALTAGVLAFLLYYVNWAWPFLSQSVPKLLAGGSSHVAEPGTPLLSRLALQPHKLAYSYGTVLVPLLGLVGLALVPARRERLVLLAWGGVLVVVGGLDLFFNFLLKHHYYVMVPMAVGAGVLLSRLEQKGRAGRAAALVLVGLACLLGAETAVAVALGEIP